MPNADTTPRTPLRCRLGWHAWSWPYSKVYSTPAQTCDRGCGESRPWGCAICGSAHLYDAKYCHDCS